MPYFISNDEPNNFYPYVDSNDYRDTTELVFKRIKMIIKEHLFKSSIMIVLVNSAFKSVMKWAKFFKIKRIWSVVGVAQHFLLYCIVLFSCN